MSNEMLMFFGIFVFSMLSIGVLLTVIEFHRIGREQSLSERQQVQSERSTRQFNYASR